MSTVKHYSIVLLVAVVLAGAAAIFYHYYSIQRTEFLNTTAVRNTVTGLGDELQAVSLLAPAADVAEAMERHYAFYVHPDLLARWKADPQLAPGRLTSTPRPDRIEITETTPNEDGSYTVSANILEVAESAQGRQVVSTIPVRFTLVQGPDGWQITAYEKLSTS